MAGTPAKPAAPSTQPRARRSRRFIAAPLADQAAVAVDRDQVDVARALRAAGELDAVAAEVAAQPGQRFLHARTRRAARLQRRIRRLDRGAAGDVALERR